MDGDKPIKRRARVARFYHAGALQHGTQLQLEKKASHHLATVLRMKAGEKIILFNGDGDDFHASLIDTGQRTTGKRALLQIESKEPGLPESPLAITLVQCVSRPERMDISLRQAVELGVTCIQPVYSRHSIKAGDQQRIEKKQLHWQSIVVSACEQSGRTILPVLCDAMTYTQWLTTTHEPDTARYVLSPNAPMSLPQHAHNLARTQTADAATLIIGPESGLDTDEIDSAIATGAIAVQIGKRILRTETAGPACIVLLQSILGDLTP